MNTPYEEIDLAGEVFYLLLQKAMYRPAKQQLILSDLHLGKASHFRKQGIPMPLHSHLRDLDKLHFLITNWQPSSVLILGDLFHSVYNKEWLWFKALLMEHIQVEFILVEGNHDILKNVHYQLTNLTLMPSLEEDDILFTHQPVNDTAKINICGHIHPGLYLTGMAKQSVKLPCFYHYKNLFVLPAFGYLTGLYLLEENKTADYYLVMNNAIIKYKF